MVFTPRGIPNHICSYVKSRNTSADSANCTPWQIPLMPPMRIPVHRPLGSDTKKAADKAYRRSRGTNAERGYDAAWRRIRLLVLAAEPMCRHCKREGKRTVAVHVDHIDADAWNRSNNNLQPLCLAHHNSKTAEDMKRMRKSVKP